MIIQKDKFFKLDLLTLQDLVTLHRRQQHVGQTETRCFDLSGQGVTLPARLSFTYSSFIELLFLLTRVAMVATSPACRHCRTPHSIS